MKATELRIGNYILDEENEVRQVIELSQTLIRTSCDFTLLTSEVKPIPLTEDILLKCGFEIDGIFCYIKSFQTIYLVKPWREANHFLLKTIGGECLSRLQHLHQLQSLYFALCGEELEVNL